MPTPTPPDLVVLGLLLAFGAWGAWQGMIRQLIALAVFAAAFPLASRFGRSLEGVVVKAASVSADDAERVAWAVVFLGVLVGGGLLFAVLRPLVRRGPRPGAAGRILAGILGIVHGTLIVAFAIHVLLVVVPVGARPPWVKAVAASRSAVGSRTVARRLFTWLPVPGWVGRPASKDGR